FNGLMRYRAGEGDNRWSLTAMGYSAGWNATDQVPRRAVDDGRIGRFGAIDTTDGGRTARASLSYDLQHATADGAVSLQAYAIRSQLSLYSDFTYFLDRPAEGDQFEQSERRTTLGLAVRRQWNTMLGG